MNLAVLELLPYLLRAERKRQVNKAQNAGTQTELYEQWIFEGVECSTDKGR